MSNEGSLFVISGPSGSGKTSLADRALKEIPELRFSVSHTTRQQRAGEQSGVDYFFVSEEEFQEMLEQKVFLEHAQVHGKCYGTSREFVEGELSRGSDVLLDIDVQGGRQVKRAYAQAVLIFVLPPSLETLRLRLENRGLDDQAVIEARLEIARKEIESYNNYDYVIINRDIEESFFELKSVILSIRCSLDKQKEKAEEILKTFQDAI